MELDFSTIHERDMDLLFLEAISTDKGFAQLFISKTKWRGKDFVVESVELSKTDPYLGESDITVKIRIDETLYGIFIEDKIDAIAMPQQHDRYIKRANQAVKKDEYSDYEIFIVCSEKYHSGNSEAKKYEHFLSYEECLEYFEAHSDTLNSVRAAWCRAAIIRSKRPYESNINEAAYDYFNHYREYMQKNYPHLDIRTKKSANGWWVQYGTTLGQAYIYHKTQEGYVDLTFPNAAEYMDTMQRIASWLRDNGNDQIIAVRTAKSAALRIECPKLKVKEDYSKTSEGDLRVCFDAISKLTEIASVFAAAAKMSELDKKG